MAHRTTKSSADVIHGSTTGDGNARVTKVSADVIGFGGATIRTTKVSADVIHGSTAGDSPARVTKVAADVIYRIDVPIRAITTVIN